MNSIKVGSTTIDSATYTPTPGAQAAEVNLATLETQLSNLHAFPDLIGSLIRMIAGNNATGKFDLDVSHTKATLILGSVTTIIAMENGAWTKKVNEAASVPVFTDVTEIHNYARLTTLFIKTLGDSRKSLTTQPAASHPAAASIHEQTSTIPAAQANPLLPGRAAELHPSLQPAQQTLHSQTAQIGQLNKDLEASQAAQRQAEEELTALKQKQAKQESALKNSETEKKQLEIIVTELQASDQILKQNLQEAQSVNSTTDTTLQHLQAAHQQTQNELATAATRLQKLTTSIATQESNIQSLTATLSEKSTAFQAEQAKVTVLTAQLRTASEANTVAQKTIMTTSNDNQKLRTQLQTTQSSLESQQSQLSEAETQLAILRAELENKSGEITRLSAKFRDLQASSMPKENYQSKITNFQEKIQKATQEKETSQQELAQLHELLAAKKQQEIPFGTDSKSNEDELRQQIAEANERAEKHFKTVKDMEEQVRVLAQKLAEQELLRVTEAEESKKIEIPQEIYSTPDPDQNALIETLLKDKQTLEKQIQDFKELMERLEIKIAELEEQQSAHSDQSSAIEKLRKQLVLLTQEKDAALLKLTEESRDFEAILTEKQMSHDSLQDQLKSLQNQQAQLETSLAAYQTNLTQLQSDLTKALKHAGDLEGVQQYENSEHDKALLALQTELDATKQELALQQAHKSTSVGQQTETVPAAQATSQTFTEETTVIDYTTSGEQTASTSSDAHLARSTDTSHEHENEFLRKQVAAAREKMRSLEEEKLIADARESKETELAQKIGKLETQLAAANEKANKAETRLTEETESIQASMQETSETNTHLRSELAKLQEEVTKAAPALAFLEEPDNIKTVIEAFIESNPKNAHLIDKILGQNWPKP